MFLRTSPSPSILSRGSRYVLRAPGCRHFSLPRSVSVPPVPAVQSLRSLPRATTALYKNPTTTAWTALVSQHPYSTAHPAEEATAMADASETGVTADSIRGKLIDQLQAQYVEIEDLSGGCGQAFMAIIVSPQFQGKNMLARHRLVNAALKSEIAAIHAWTPKCYTPEQWQSMQQ